MRDSDQMKMVVRMHLWRKPDILHVSSLDGLRLNMNKVYPVPIQVAVIGAAANVIERSSYHRFVSMVPLYHPLMNRGRTEP